MVIEMEGKMMPENQTGFRRGKTETMENIYVLNYVINRELTREKEKMWACFFYIKAAFDSVNRGKL